MFFHTTFQEFNLLPSSGEGFVVKTTVFYFLLFFKISSPKIRVHRLFDGMQYLRIYGNSPQTMDYLQQNILELPVKVCRYSYDSLRIVLFKGKGWYRKMSYVSRKS